MGKTDFRTKNCLRNKRVSVVREERLFPRIQSLQVRFCFVVCVAPTADRPERARGYLPHLLVCSSFRHASSDCANHGIILPCGLLVHLVLCPEHNDTLHTIKR